MNDFWNRMYKCLNLLFNDTKVMKKGLLLLSSILLGFAFNSFGQINIYHTGDATDYAGDTMYVVAPNYDQFDVHIEVHNNTGATHQWRIARQRIDIPTGWTDGLCWGHCTDPLGGICYSSSQMVNDFWMSNGGASVLFDIADGECGKLKPQINPDDFVSGQAQYRYYITSADGNTFEDSVDVVVDFTAAVKAVNNDVLINVVPNPATDYVTISMQGAENGSLRIFDVLGNVVLKDNISGTKKVDLSDFRNGVYFIKIETSSGKSITRKLIVKH